MRIEYEKAVSICLTDAKGQKFVCSALLEKDPNYLHWNRMSLIGTREHWESALPISHNGGTPLKWNLENNSAWPYQDLSEDKGTAIVRSFGMWSGINISDDSIQKFADLDIIEYETNFLTEYTINKSRVEYVFLQRPQDWFIGGGLKGHSKRGNWRKILGSGLKIRLFTFKETRNDPRLSNEIELLELGGIEIASSSDGTLENLFNLADDVWFCLRVLISFRFRQFALTAFELKVGENFISQKWHTVRLEPRSVSDEHRDPPVFASTVEFFAAGLPKLLKCVEQRQLLHAAIWGYAESFRAFIMEAGLTGCVEALERLVSAFEASEGLTTEPIGKSDWKKIAAAMAKSVDDLGVSPEIGSIIKRSKLDWPPTLTLQQRIERMVERYSHCWCDQDRETLLSGIAGMIRARNGVVHGRLVDAQVLWIERMRVRAIFEKLFLAFLGCERFPTSGWPQHVIAVQKFQKAQQNIDLNRSK